MFPPRSGSESGSGEHRLSSGDDPRSSAARVPSFFLPQLGAVHRAEQKLKGRVGKTGEISAGLGLQQQSDSAAFFSGFFSFASPGGVTEEPRFRSRYHRLRQRHKDTSELRIELQPGTEEQLQSPPVSSHTAPPDRAALEKMNTRTNTHAHEHSFHCDL